MFSSKYGTALPDKILIAVLNLPFQSAEAIDHVAASYILQGALDRLERLL
ncbi:MAG: hypothetical protein AAGJ34_13655 [Pseudomonadota bacterium]